MNHSQPTGQEMNELLEKIQVFIKPHLHHFGSERNTFAQIDKREKMYGGEGVVYLLQMFEKDELVNNRIGAYMILPEKGNSAGFHTHGTRNEQELYVVVHGEGIYFEKETWEAPQKSIVIQKGSVTSIRGEGYHSVKNRGEDPLIIFVITTNETE